MAEPMKIGGFELFKGHLNPAEQAALVAELRNVAQVAPMRSPVTRWGKPMSVKMTSAGRVGWISGPSRLSVCAQASRWDGVAADSREYLGALAGDHGA